MTEKWIFTETEKDGRDENSPHRKVYEKPELTVFDDLRTVTGLNSV